MDLGDNFTAVIIVMVCVIGPIWLSKHYKMKAQTVGSLSANEMAQIDQLNRAAATLETRVAALERVLDADAPAWRGGTP